MDLSQALTGLVAIGDISFVEAGAGTVADADVSFVEAGAGTVADVSFEEALGWPSSDGGSGH